MRFIFVLLFASLSLFSAAAFSASKDDIVPPPYVPKTWEPYGGPKVGLAVLSFEDGLSQQPIANWISADVSTQVFFGLGEGISNMFVSTLMRTGRFEVLDKKISRRVFDLHSDIAAKAIVQEGTSSVPELKGIKYFILGSLTDYSDGSAAEGGIGFKGVRISAGKQVASITIHLRIIDSSSGKVVFSDAVNGTVEVRKGGIDLSGLGVDANFAASVATPIGLAIQKVLDTATDKVIDLSL